MKWSGFLMFLIVALFAACKGNKETVAAGSQSTTETPPPEWVGNRPHSASHYIGRC